MKFLQNVIIGIFGILYAFVGEKTSQMLGELGEGASFGELSLLHNIK